MENEGNKNDNDFPTFVLNSQFSILNSSLPRNNYGFTILEVLLVLLVMAIVAGALAPYSFKMIDEVRESAARKEMDAIYRAIAGDPAAGQYGYVGNMGGLPAKLADLNTNPGAPAYNSNNTNGIGMGWNGPYINSGYAGDDYMKDPWTHSYLYNSTTGQITCLGSDGRQGTNDDLVIPSSPITPYGDISATVTVADSTNPSVMLTLDGNSAAVWVYYANNGTEASASAPWSNGSKVFTTQGWRTHPHQGIHAVKAVGLGSYAGSQALVNVVVTKGTASVNIFLGMFNLNGNGNGNSNVVNNSNNNGNGNGKK